MIRYKAEFDRIPWDAPMPGVRHKCFEQNNLRLRLVEYSRQMPPHWCEKGHMGIVLEGCFEIEYERETVVYNTGQGIFIPEGPAHKHRGRVLSDKVLVFFIESA